MPSITVGTAAACCRLANTFLSVIFVQSGGGQMVRDKCNLLDNIIVTIAVPDLYSAA